MKPARHAFGYSLHETAAERKVRLGGYDPHPGWSVPLRARFSLPGHEWANLGLAVSVAATLARKGVLPHA
jgi:hypothetical protein